MPSVLCVSMLNYELVDNKNIQDELKNLLIVKLVQITNYTPKMQYPKFDNHRNLKKCYIYFIYSV